MVGVVADRVIVELEAKVDRHIANTRRAESEFRRRMGGIEGSAKRTERAVERSSTNMGRSIRRLVAGVSVIALTRQTQLMADTWTEAGNKIAAASQIAGRQARTLGELRIAASEARSEFVPYVDLYSRLLRGTKDVAIGELEVAKATEIVAKAFKAGGASAQEQASGITQLGQAVQSGFLQGEELRAIRENAPLVAQAIADEFETTIGGLKKLGEEGKLTSDRLVAGILKGEDDIEAAFATTTATIGDSFTRLRNALTEYIGTSDAVQGSADQLNDAINFVADNLDLFTDALQVAGVALVSAFGARAAAQVVAGLASIHAQLATVAFFSGRAAASMTLLRASTAFLGGPVLAGVTLLAGALAFMSVRAQNAEASFRDFDATLGKHQKTLSQIADDERRVSSLKKLLDTNEGITDAIREQGFASEEALRIEVESINRRIDKNKELLETYEVILRAQVAAAEGAIAAERQQLDIFRGEAAQSDVLGLPFEGFFQGRDLEGEISRRREEIFARQDAGERLTEQENEFLQATAKIAEYEQQLVSAREALEKLGEPIARAGGVAKGVTGLSEEEIKENEKLLKKLEDAYNNLFDTEIQGIERTRRERLEAIEKSALSEEDKARERVRVNVIADEEIIRSRRETAQEEIDLVNDVLDARDRATGRFVTIVAREFKARKAQIEREIQNERRKNEALRALAEEEAEFRRRTLLELPGNTRDDGGIRSEIEQVRETERAKLEELSKANQAALVALADTEEEKLAIIEEFERRRRNVIEESESQIRDIRQRFLEFQLSTTSDTFGKLSDVAKKFAGEQSGIYRTLFAVQQSFAVASAVVSTANAVTKALESAPPPANFIQAAVVAAAGAAEIATIVAASFREGGMIRGPGGPRDDAIPAVVDGRTPIRVSDGEFIVNAEATRRNRRVLEDINSGRDAFQDGGLVAPSMRIPNINAGPAQAQQPVVQVPAPEVRLTNINAIDAEDLVSKALSTRGGQRVILNFMQRNRGSVKAALQSGGGSGA